MIKNEWFYHEQTPNGRSLGFSIRVMPAHGADETDWFGHKQVWFASTRCSRKEKHFNKKLAREQLRDTGPTLVLCKDVPALMRRIRNLCEYGPSPDEMNESFIKKGYMYNEVLKKFL